MVASGKKVFVGLSGGVDSSVSACLLKEAGYDVTGVFIKVWQPSFVSCTFEEDRLSAMRVCAELGIPFKTLDLENEYKKGVIDYMIAQYRLGQTPNPDVMCNKEVKFGAFLNWAKSEGADYIATGHYARIAKRETQNVKHDNGEYQLLRGVDESKDQSYFLWTLKQEQLRHILFPVGHMKKTKVREIARKAGLSSADKKDSQGLCFISNVDMKEFLKHFMPSARGYVLNEGGEVIGYHHGAIFLTLGERHGFTITKKTPHDAPYYVIKKDIAENTITVSHKYIKGGLSAREVKIADLNFIEGNTPPPGIYTAEARYHGKKIPIEVTKDGDSLRFVLKEDQLAPPGQSLVLFDGDRCLGGGVIV